MPVMRKYIWLFILLGVLSLGYWPRSHAGGAVSTPVIENSGTRINSEGESYVFTRNAGHGDGGVECDLYFRWRRYNRNDDHSNRFTAAHKRQPSGRQ